MQESLPRLNAADRDLGFKREEIPARFRGRGGHGRLPDPVVAKELVRSNCLKNRGRNRGHGAGAWRVKQALWKLRGLRTSDSGRIPQFLQAPLEFADGSVARGMSADGQVPALERVDRARERAKHIQAQKPQRRTSGRLLPELLPGGRRLRDRLLAIRRQRHVLGFRSTGFAFTARILFSKASDSLATSTRGISGVAKDLLALEEGLA